MLIESASVQDLNGWHGESFGDDISPDQREPHEIRGCYWAIDHLR